MEIRRTIALAAAGAALVAPASASAWTSGGFHSPTANLRCHLYAEGLACEDRSTGNIAALVEGTAHRISSGYGMHVAWNSHVVLYGQTWGSSIYGCRSMTSGIRCFDRRTGAGFLIARGILSIS